MREFFVDMIETDEHAEELEAGEGIQLTVSVPKSLVLKLRAFTEEDQMALFSAIWRQREARRIRFPHYLLPVVLAVVAVASILATMFLW